MGHSLTVYKASAGSGKTFTLAVEYIRLLIVDPSNYKSILAVTFTKKATEEMKTRILSQLYGIWKGLPKSDDYLEAIVARLSESGITCILQEEQRQGYACKDIRSATRRRAGVALSAILHDYNRFNVETIDSFFQRVMRNLARELGLMANMRISLDRELTVNLAVDEMIDELDSGSPIMQWIMSYIREQMEQDKAWNVTGGIKDFGLTIFEDFYKQHTKELERCYDDADFFIKYKATIRKVMSTAIESMKKRAADFYAAVERAGLDESQFSKRSGGVFGYIDKLARGEISNNRCRNKTLLNLMESSEGGWVNKSNKRREEVLDVVEGTLIGMLRKTEEERLHQWKLYHSAEATLEHLDKLRLLGSIEAKVRQLNAETGTFLLCDTQSLLKELIGNNDAPFIYEKTGSHLKYIMIDEFQDTSTTQWHNFKVLLNDTMSHSTDGNIIVGDVKQSIYRWRSGDWRLLNNIRSEIPTLDEDDVKSLDTNYRSEPAIVNFNSTFFRLARELTLQEEEEVVATNRDMVRQIATAYDDVVQKVKDATGVGPYECRSGSVIITLLPTDKDIRKAQQKCEELRTNNEESGATGGSYDGRMLDAIASRVEMLLAEGTPQSAITILVRKNRHIPGIAKHLMALSPDISVVSDEAFRLDASLAVRALIQAMTVLITPGEILPRAELAKSYERVIGRTRQDQAGPGRTIPIAEQLDELRGELLDMPLSDLVERLYRLLHLELLPDETAYVCAFNDAVRAFVDEHFSDVGSLLEAWKTDICKKTIPGDSVDGIRIMSIHKSKGLEFDHVIVPYCDWNLQPTQYNPTTMWLSPKEEPFSELPLVPVIYKRDLPDTIYADDYYEEHIQLAVDNLNLLYVAFTRAKRNLYVIGKRNASDSRSFLIEKLLPSLQRELKGPGATGVGPYTIADQPSSDTPPDEPLTFEYGVFSPTKDTGSHDTAGSGNVFLTEAGDVEVKIETFDTSVEFRQSNESRRFTGGDDDDDSDARTLYINKGSILHNIFARIRTIDDIPYIIKEMQTDGLLYTDDITAEEVEKHIERGMANEQVRNWFSPHWRLFNECSIIYEDDEGHVQKRRPDRVITDGQQTIVIDFKFARQREEHKEQVREYMLLLRDMGYPDVSGYLWYGYTNKIEEVRV